MRKGDLLESMRGRIKESVLKANDCCFIGPNESREIINRGNDVVTMLVAVSTPQK